MKYLDEAVFSYTAGDVYPFHMPGHKRSGVVFPEIEPWDITEVAGFEDLSDTEALAAALYGAKKTFLSVNGSSGALLSAISAAVQMGEPVLCARNVHRCIAYAMYQNGLKAKWLHPAVVDGFFGPVDPEEIRIRLKEDPKIRAVILTSPTYEGVVSDIAAIAEIVHEKGLPLIVDEAHGAHFLPFAEGFPKSAVSLGADLVIQSLHKTLPSPTQTALLHLCSDRIDPERLQRFFHIYQNSSPSYVLMSGMSKCFRFLKDRGKAEFQNYRKRLEAFGEDMKTLQNIRLWEFPGKDPGKLVLKIGKEADLSGPALSSVLKESYGLELEMAGLSYCLAMTSVMDTKNAFRRLFEALKRIDLTIREGEARKDADFPEEPLFEKVMEIREAWDLPKQWVSVEEAVGQIAGECVTPYPPGIPVLLPGERVSAQWISYLKQLQKAGLAVHGMDGAGRIAVVMA